MPPESFNPRKTDLQSLIRSGTWLYQTGQRAATPPSDRAEGTPPPPLSFNSINDLNLSDTDLNDVEFNAFNLSNGASDRSSDYPTFNPEGWEYPLEQIEPSTLGETPEHRHLISSAKRWMKVGWLWIPLMVLIPLGMAKGIQWLSPDRLAPDRLALDQLPLSSSTLLPPPSSDGDPSLRSLGDSGDNLVSLEQALQNADQAMALTVQATTTEDWQDIAAYWQNAIDALQAIPPSNPNYATAQNRLVSYYNQLNYAQGQFQSLETEHQALAEQDAIFHRAVSTAIHAAELTQTATTPQQWQVVVEQWETAIVDMSQIVPQSPHYPIAQDRIPTYTNNLNYAKRQAGVLP